MTLGLIYSRTEVFMCKINKEINKQEIHRMCRLPPRLLYNRSRTEQEGVFYPSWSLVCAGKAHISSNRAYLSISTTSLNIRSLIITCTASAKRVFTACTRCVYLPTESVSFSLKLQSTWSVFLAWRNPLPLTTTWKLSREKWRRHWECATI